MGKFVEGADVLVDRMSELFEKLEVQIFRVDSSVIRRFDYEPEFWYQVVSMTFCLAFSLLERTAKNCAFSRLCRSDERDNFVWRRVEDMRGVKLLCISVIPMPDEPSTNQWRLGFKHISPRAPIRRCRRL